MNLIKKFTTATQLFRKQFGHVRGTILWISLLQEKWLAPSRIFSVKVPGLAHPVKLRAHTSDLEVFCQIFGHAELNNEFDHPVSYIIDAGANIGLSSIFLANKYRDVVIDAVEVSASNIELLEMNVGPYPNISVIQKGLWGRSATLKIKNPQAEPWAFIVEETRHGDPDGIETVSVSDLLQARGKNAVDILKIDIEGAEAEVFGATGTPWLSSVNCLMIELHDHIKPGCSDSVLGAVNHHAHTHTQQGEYHVFRFLH